MLNSRSGNKRLDRRIILDRSIKIVFSFSVFIALGILTILLSSIIIQSIGWLDWQFLTSNLSINAQRAGIKGVITGTLLMMVILAPVTLILGVATAIFLEEYVRKGWFHSIVKINISNLSAVPSVIFGLLGLTIFSRLLGLGSSILAGALTMSLLILPIVVVSAQEAIKAVPGFLREASYAMGATKWTTIRKVVLPSALQGILTGSILGLSRAIGETAPLIVTGIPALILKMPQSIMDNFTALPVQIYYWTLDSVLVREYANLAAATIVVLLTMLLTLNVSAIILRSKFQRRY
jgi:phosphate transport system permease protein